MAENKETTEITSDSRDSLTLLAFYRTHREIFEFGKNHPDETISVTCIGEQIIFTTGSGTEYYIGLDTLGENERKVVMRAITDKEREGSKLTMSSNDSSQNSSVDKENEIDRRHEDSADSDQSFEMREISDQDDNRTVLNKVVKALDALTTTQKDMTKIFLKGMTALIDKIDGNCPRKSENQNSGSNKRQNERDETNPGSTAVSSEARNTEPGIRRDEIIELIRNEMRQTGHSSNRNVDRPSTSGTDVVKEISEKIRVELVGKDTSKREYKLTHQTKYEHFMDFLTSELRILDLLYIINPNEKPNFTVDDATREKHTFKVRDILINRLDQYYYSKIDKLKDPIEILNKIKEMKRYETNLTSMTIRKRLYNMEYVPSKEKAAEFWDRFEELVRNYDSLPNVNPLSHDEKRDAFFNAITTAIPQVQSIEFLTTNSTGKGLTYDQLKAFIIQHEANKTQTNDTKPAAMSVRKHDSKSRCYGCGGQGHHADECPNEGKPQCYECGKIGHIARECSVRKNKQSDSATSSKYVSASKQHSKNAHRPMNSSSFRGKRKFGGPNRENSAKRAKFDKGRGGQQKNKDQGNQDEGKENQNGNKMRKGGKK